MDAPANHSSITVFEAVSADDALAIKRTKEYPYQVWYFLACFIGLVSILHWTGVLFTFVKRRFFTSPPDRSTSGADVEKGGRASPVKLGTWNWRRVPIALANLFRVFAFRYVFQLGSYTLNVAEVVLTAVYIIILFVWTMINSEGDGMKYNWESYSNRSATIATSQFVLVVALGTKNNVLTWLTGVSYEKLNYLHRMTARVTFVLLWLHAGAKFHMGIYASTWPTEWFHWGFAGLVGFTLIVAASFRPIRNRAYEFFFYLHFSMVLVFLLGGYYHTRQFNYHSYMWPCFLIWGLDRFIRLMGVISFKTLSTRFFRSKSKSSTDSELTDAQIDLLSPHMVRLRVPRPSHCHWSAGQSAYIIVPAVSILPFEAHPFSIASVDETQYPEADRMQPTESGAEYWKQMVFLINAQDGFTKRLTKVASKGETQVQVLVDGPYGHMPDNDDSTTVILVSGGTGVTHTLPLLIDTVHRVRSGLSKCRRIVFLWAIRDRHHLAWIAAALSKVFSLCPQYLSITIRVHVTSSPREPPPTSPEAWDNDSIHIVNEMPGHQTQESSFDEKKEPNSSVTSLSDYPALQVLEGRPDLGTILREEVQSASGHVSVSVCGSQGLAGAVRDSLAFNPLSNVSRGGASVTLHMEAFGYA